MILPLKKIDELEIFTPTKWQTFLIKNYGMVEDSIIQKILKIDLSTLKKEANRLGLNKIKFDNAWKEKSPLTIIRSNWSLLPYDQLCTLLSIDMDFLSHELENNDFLWVKLGGFKPDVEPIEYIPLNEEQRKETSRLKKIVSKNVIEEYIHPFDFHYHSLKESISSCERIIYPYSLPYGDVFLSSSDLLNDEELDAYRKAGATSLWVPIALKDFSPYPFYKNQSYSWKERRKNLAKFAAKAASFGLKTCIYLNEPRSIGIDEIMEEYKYLEGRKEGDQVALCFSQKEVRDYLYEATKSLLDEVDAIEEIFTITASENLTHCKRNLGSDCPKCKDIPPYVMAAEINNVIYRAAKDSKSKAEVIANLWGWMPYCGFINEDTKKGIDLLDKNISVMSVSEFGTHKQKGETFEVGEYSISHGEPSIETKEFLRYAKKKGHKIYAKIQVNNCWEISSIPSIPCFELVINHIEKLKRLGVNDLMLSWTLGGYPGLNLSLASSALKDDFDYDMWLKESFGDKNEVVKKVSHLFSNGFKKIRFSTNVLYMSPINIGPANPIYSKKTNRNSTMVAFPYDDIDGWLNGVDRDGFIMEMKSCVFYFKKGLKIIENEEGDEVFESFKRNAKAMYLIYKSALNQCLFYLNEIDKIKCLKEEIKLAKELYHLASIDSCIGFEASNQYIFSPNIFIEKIINLYKLLEK
ncbi:MAG: hypothetical protein IJ247_05800 [Bacilli bacterium]|nr:hypothetical protein [Bacilli bacterium]